MTNKRLISIITAMLFLFTVFFSVMCIISCTNHECTDSDNCTVCSEIKLCQDLLQDFALAQPNSETETRKTTSFRVVKRTTLPSRMELRSTLVSLKIKLSD